MGYKSCQHHGYVSECATPNALNPYPMNSTAYWQFEDGRRALQQGKTINCRGDVE